MSTSLGQVTSLLPSPTSSNSAEPISPGLETKLDKINAALDNNDLATLRQLASQPGGFQTSQLRAKVWPILLGSFGSDNSSQQAHSSAADEIAEPPTTAAAPTSTPDATQFDPLTTTTPEPIAHRDEGQVKLDVNRSFVNYPKDITSNAKDQLRERLERVIVHTIRKFPSLRYFQGYHDIISVLLLTIDDDDTLIEAADRMSLHRLRDSMGVGLEPVLGYLRLVYRIIEHEDPSLAAVVEQAAPLPFFSLSWVLTLMSHDLDSFPVISRLFDFLLAYNPAMMSYLGAAVILLKKEELAMLDEDAAEDPAMLHHTLAKMPNFVMDGFPFDHSVSGGSPDQDVGQLGFGQAELIPGPGSVRSVVSEGQGKEDDSILTSSVISLTEAESTSELTLTSSAPSSASSTSSLTHLSRPVEYDPDFDSSLDDFSHAALSDPDVTGPAFSSPEQSFSHSRSGSDSPSLIRQSSPIERSASPSTPRSPLSPPTSIETLIQSALELWERHPLVGEGGIDADRVMGPKSCIFTWGLSEDGLLDDAGAEAIVQAGIDIVLPEQGPEDDGSGAEKEARDEKGRADKPNKSREVEERRRRQRLLLVGTAVGVVGVGVLIAVWGSEWRGGGASSSRTEWRWLRWMGW